MALTESHSRSLARLDPAAFRERGHAVVRQRSDVQEVQRLRAVAREALAEGTIRHHAGDLLNIPSLCHVLRSRTHEHE